MLDICGGRSSGDQRRDLCGWESDETSVEKVKMEEKETARMTPKAPHHSRLERHEITRFPRGLFKEHKVIRAAEDALIGLVLPLSVTRRWCILE